MKHGLYIQPKECVNNLAFEAKHSASYLPSSKQDYKRWYVVTKIEKLQKIFSKHINKFEVLNNPLEKIQEGNVMAAKSK
jgi:hypothetical protein